MSLTLEETRSYLDSINFTPIVNRLIKEKNWLKEEAEDSLELYKRYLLLQKKYGSQYYLVPTPDIDEIWHAHILYTEDYHQHCQQMFGKYFHHRPEEPILQDSYPSDLKKMFDDTQELYFKEYGEYLSQVRFYTLLGRIVIYFAKLIRKMKHTLNIKNGLFSYR